MNKVKMDMNWVMFFSILTGILAICTAIAQSIKEKKDSAERLADKIEIIKLQKENNSKLQEINSLQNQILNYQSGGDSYPYVDILKILDDKGEANLTLVINKVGKYPLYEVNVTYWNLDEISKLSRPDGRVNMEILDKYQRASLGTLAQDGSTPFGPIFKLNTDGLTKINMTINTKNGTFSEILRINKSGKDLSYAYKVNTVANGNTPPKVLKEYADPLFPSNQDGAINWN